MLRHPIRPIVRQSSRLLACSASRNDQQFHGRNLTANEIMAMAANKATRFVYLRTLPLVKQTELEGQIDAVAANIKTMTKDLCEKHLVSVIDDRSAVHLHTTSLAIATHRVLSPHIKNEIRLSNIIRAGFGAALLDDPSKRDESKQFDNSERMRPDFWVVRAALWFSFDRMAAIRKMTANMVRDFGSQFKTESRDQTEGSVQKHELIVRKCYYNTLCREEGLPHLTKIFCALDRAIYSPITQKSHGIEFSLAQTLADDPQDGNRTGLCNFKFVQGRE